jgi:hypothetical protein
MLKASYFVRSISVDPSRPFGSFSRSSRCNTSREIRAGLGRVVRLAEGDAVEDRVEALAAEPVEAMANMPTRRRFEGRSNRPRLTSHAVPTGVSPPSNLRGYPRPYSVTVGKATCLYPLTTQQVEPVAGRAIGSKPFRAWESGRGKGLLRWRALIFH